VIRSGAVAGRGGGKQAKRFAGVSLQERGFTLIELLVVVVILGLLAAIAIPRVLGAIERAHESKAVADIRVIVSGLERYFFGHGVFPTHLGLLRGAYLKSDFPFTNAHGHVYFYAVRWDNSGDIDNLSQYAIGNPTNPPGDVALTNWTWNGLGDRPPLPQGVEPLLGQSRLCFRCRNQPAHGSQSHRWPHFQAHSSRPAIRLKGSADWCPRGVPPFCPGARSFPRCTPQDRDLEVSAGREDLGAAVGEYVLRQEDIDTTIEEALL